MTTTEENVGQGFNKSWKIFRYKNLTSTISSKNFL